MLIGSIDQADRTRLRGWVHDTDYPRTPVSLLVTIDGELLDRVIANEFRSDLEQAGIGNGRFGFDLTHNPPLPGLRPVLVHLRSEADGAEMPGSPIRIGAARDFDGAARDATSALLASATSRAEIDTNLGFLAEQRERLLQKRSGLHPARSRRTAGAGRPRALVVDQQAPEPGRDGGSGALLSHMLSLQRLGYAVTFAAADMRDGAPARVLEQLQIAVCRPPVFGSVEEVLRREPDGYDIVYLHRVMSAGAYSMLVRQHQPRARLIYNVADLHHLRLARQSQLQSRPDLLAEARRIQTQEIWAARMADAVITHSEAEARLLQQAVPAERVHTVAWSATGRSRPLAWRARRGMAFIGNFAHAPNEAAARHLRDTLLPRLHASAPQIGCRIVGHDAPAWLRAAGQEFESVGPVQNLGAVFRAVRLTIAPLEFGAGLKSKVLESLAAGVPCVCSPVAAEGMRLTGELCDLIVPDVDAAVSAIIRLHEDAAYNRRLSALGCALAADQFSEQSLDCTLRRAISA